MADAQGIKQFLGWCNERRLKLAEIEAISVLSAERLHT